MHPKSKLEQGQTRDGAKMRRQGGRIHGAEVRRAALRVRVLVRVGRVSGLLCWRMLTEGFCCELASHNLASISRRETSIV